MRKLHFDPTTDLGESYVGIPSKTKPDCAISMQRYFLQSSQGVVNLGNQNSVCYTGEDEIHPCTRNLEYDELYNLKRENEAKIDKVMSDITEDKKRAKNAAVAAHKLKTESEKGVSETKE